MAKTARLDVKAIGLTAGLLWGGGVLVLGLTSMIWGYGTPIMNLIASVYLGYRADLIGSIIGGVWGFIDAGVGGVIFAWLYNKLAK